MRARAIGCLAKAHAAALPLLAVARALHTDGMRLAVASKSAESDEDDNESDDEDDGLPIVGDDGLSECAACLQSHGAAVVSDGAGNLAFDAKETKKRFAQR